MRKEWIAKGEKEDGLLFSLKLGRYQVKDDRAACFISKTYTYTYKH